MIWLIPIAHESSHEAPNMAVYNLGSKSKKDDVTII